MNDGSGETILVAKGLELGYGRHMVLRGVNLEVRAAERWFIVGPNGQGKTTLLRGILGLLPAAGLRRHADAMRAQNIGFVPQRCDLNPALPTTVREFISLGLIGQKLSRAERAARVAEALEQVHLGRLIESDYYALSGGQRQRTLLARALARRPRVLLLDEPASGLDLTSQRALMDVLIERNRTDGLTILYVTHDVALAARYATHVALVHDGTVNSGPATEILERSLLERAYRVSVEVACT